MGAAAPEELGALLREAGPAAILCGVHAHGAALCAETGDEPAGDGAALLLGALLPALDRELAGLLL